MKIQTQYGYENNFQCFEPKMTKKVEATIKIARMSCEYKLSKKKLTEIACS